MTDVAFLLLTFFLTSAVFVRHRDPKIELPSAQNIRRVVETENVVDVWIDSEGRVDIDGHRVSLEQIGAVLRAEVRADPQRVVSIHVDGRTQFGMLSGVLKELRQADARRIVFATERKRDP